MNPRLLFLAALILLHGSASASTAEAEKRLQTAVNEVLAAADAAPSRGVLLEYLNPILQRHMSFDAMTRRAVGPCSAAPFW